MIRRKAKAAAKKKPARAGAGGTVKFPWGSVIIKLGQRVDLSCLSPRKAPAVINIVQGEASPGSPRLHFQGVADRVVWYNKDATLYTIHFEQEKWPFKEDWRNIKASPGQFSETFTVKDTGKITPVSFAYIIVGAGRGPGVPEVITEP